MRNDQGQSNGATPEKERGIASALAISMNIAAIVIRRNQWFGRRFPYWHLDTNAGCGWNDIASVPGSPVVFHQMAQKYLQDIKREAWFCDIDKKAIEKLLIRLGQWNEDSILFNKDNEEVLQFFADRLADSGENPNHMMGSVLIDPNGWFYRNKQGRGVPIKGLTEFARKFPKIDLILNLNTRSRRTMLGNTWYKDDVSPREVFNLCGKIYWHIKRTQRGGDEFMLAIGRNMKTVPHYAAGFHELDSEEGCVWMQIFEGRRQGKLEFPNDGVSPISDS